MKIKTGSWHYKFLIWIWNETPSNLCSYFWGLVLSIIFLPIVLFVKLLDKAFHNYNGLPDNLVFNMMKAKKQKYCPHIEFIEELEQ